MKRLYFLSQEGEESNSKEGKRKMDSGYCVFFLDRKKKYMGTKLLDFESEGPIEMMLGPKNVCPTPQLRGIWKTCELSPFLSCVILPRDRRRLSLAAKAVAETLQMPSWGFFVLCNVFSICLFR